MTIPITLTILGIALATSAIYQLQKPNIHREYYEMQMGFLIIGIIYFGVGVIGIFLYL